MAWITLLIPVVALVCVFTFVAVAAWSDNRRKEREAYYRHETYQKMLEGGGGSVEVVGELIREEESRRESRRLAGLELGLKLGGLVTLAAGVGLAVFLYVLRPFGQVHLVGVIPILVGAVLFFYGTFLLSRQTGPS